MSCEAGSYAEYWGTGECDLCTPGHYVNFKGSTKCLECKLGFEAPANGTALCSACQPGSFANETGIFLLTHPVLFTPGSVPLSNSLFITGNSLLTPSPQDQ